MDYKEAWLELAFRISKAERELIDLKVKNIENADEFYRLDSKLQGVKIIEQYLIEIGTTIDE